MRNLFCGAKSQREYVNSIYMTAAFIGLLLSHSTTIYKSEQMFRFLDKFENFINARKFLGSKSLFLLRK